MGIHFDPEIAELLGDSSLSNLPVPDDCRVSSGTGRESMIAGDAYEGASALSREMALWAPLIRSADQDIIPAKPRTDARTRDMMRNDAYAQGAANLHRDSIVGSMFMLNAKPSTRVLFGKEDDVWEDEFQAEVEEKFTLWAESPNNWPDAGRKNTFTGLVRMAVGIHLVRGEFLASAEWLKDPTSLCPFRTAIQVVDLDRLSTPNYLLADRNVRGGVRVDRYGAPQGYYIRMSHPSDWLSTESYDWKYVPIKKPWGRFQMMHIFEQVREEQSRGMAQMVSALKEMRMTKNFRDIVLQNAVINATYAASIESELPTAEIFARLGGGEMTPEAIQAALSGYMGGHFATMAQFLGGAKNLNVNGAKIPHLPPGSKLQLRGAGEGGPLGTDFEASLLRYIAASLNVSYEQLSNDYTKTNYASAKTSAANTEKGMQSRKKGIADRAATLWYRLWLEEAINAGKITSMPRNAPNWYEDQNADAYSNCSWIGASRGQIDELKETQAAVLRINNGLSTIEVEAARLGIDWRLLFKQLYREKQLKIEYNILQDQTDTTDMMNATTGKPREKGDGDQSDADE